MVETIRTFRGTTELSVGGTSNIIKSNDQVVNLANIEIEANDDVTHGSVIDFKKADGVTTKFSGKVIQIKEEDMWALKIFSNGHELNSIKIQQVYVGYSPEEIVEDVIGQTSTLTYASTGTSGITLEKYVANAYDIDVIKDMMELLEWQLRIDENDNVYFETDGNVDNGLTLTNGVNCQIKAWESDDTKRFNRVKIKGGLVTYRTEDEALGNGDSTTTEFDLDNKPEGTVILFVDGTEQKQTEPNEKYEVNQETPSITFTTAPDTGEAITASYSFYKPVVVDIQDDDSIEALGYEIYREIEAPWLNDFASARQYATQLLSVFSLQQIKAKIVIPGIDWNRDVGEIITVVDSVRSKDAVQMVTSKVTYNLSKNETMLEMGTRDFVMFDWQRRVEDRIKKIERRITDEQEVVFSRLLKNNMKVTIALNVLTHYASPNDSFILGHQTLSRLRSGLDYEADCSDNSHNGTWSGTGVTTGAQYTLSGFRLSAGIFNGSDRYITVTDHADLDNDGTNFTIALAVKVSTLPSAEKYILNKYDGTDGYAIRINASNQVELIYSDSGSDSTIAASTALTANVWQHIVFTKSSTSLTVYVNGSSNNTETGSTLGTNSNNLEIGRYSTDYFNGQIDEFRMYNSALSSGEVSDLYNKIQKNDNMTIYLSMDNPKLGDRRSSKVNWQTGGVLLETDNTTFRDNSAINTAYWDTTNDLLAMSSEDNQSQVYNTFATSKNLFDTKNKIQSVTLTADETKYGSDTILYYVNCDENDNNWEEVSLNNSYTIQNPGTKIRVRVFFAGNGGVQTYIENLEIVPVLES